MHELVQAIADAADPADAIMLAKYFQVRPGGYGEGDVFVGVKLSRLRGLAAPYVREPFVPDRWLPLLRSPVHEHRLIALVVMNERARRNGGPRGSADELEMVYRCYLDHTAYVDNWDLVDVSCKAIVGGHLQNRDRAPLYLLARSTSIWERRIAMVGAQHFLKSGDTADVFALAEGLLADPHDLMHKAVGWSLREAGRRDRAALRRFLDAHATEMPRTALRYAIEHFDPEERSDYLGRARALRI
jgi:3-methyladenine DNA glycosylase AlkD